MNRFLASTLEVFNIALAVGIFLFSVSAFSGVGFVAGLSPSISLLLSAVIGVVLAGIACGMIAMIVLIEAHLRRIADRLDGQNIAHPLRRDPPIDRANVDHRF
jgi:hypothetical protein